MNIITAAMVSALRDRTDAPMMECKRALVACKGDMDKATEWIRYPPTLEQRVQGLEDSLDKCGTAIAEWRKGCSCAPKDEPWQCSACTHGLLDALESFLKK